VDSFEAPDAQTLRRLILEQSTFVSLLELVSFCWSLGIPVLQLHVFPLKQKRMHAMTVRVEDRYAILLGFETRYYARVAYILAHEIGHILLGHLEQSDALLEIDDPLTSGNLDGEETAADRFALALLTGTETPRVIANVQQYTATQLAHAAMDMANKVRIEPGVLALCLGHSTKQWRKAIGALKIIPPGEQEVGGQINEVASHQLNWEALSLGNREYLMRIMGRDDDS
jgi:hypothetical protein